MIIRQNFLPAEASEWSINSSIHLSHHYVLGITILLFYNLLSVTLKVIYVSLHGNELGVFVYERLQSVWDVSISNGLVIFIAVIFLYVWINIFLSSYCVGKCIESWNCCIFNCWNHYHVGFTLRHRGSHLHIWSF